MDLEVIRRVVLARHLFEQALSSIRSKNNVLLFAAVNSAQDAVEIFLVSVIQHLQIQLDKKPDFDKLFVAIEGHIGQPLPHRTSMQNLNKVRVNSKHYGIEPSRDECERHIASAKKFLEEVSLICLGKPFYAVSPLDLLSEGRPKDHLAAALIAIEQGDYAACLVECRKAIYSEVESQYDIINFRSGTPPGLLLRATKAPQYARESWYFDEFVHEPTSFISLDRASVSAELLAAGADPTAFWNILRLTPAVYFHRQEKRWSIKHELRKLNNETVRENAEYVLGASIDMVLALHHDKRQVRQASYCSWVITPRCAGVPLFKKADSDSEVLLLLTEHCSEIECIARVDGLNGPLIFWEVSTSDFGQFGRAYIRGDDVVGEPRAKQ